jgi:hypothetical protein
MKRKGEWENRLNKYPCEAMEICRFRVGEIEFEAHYYLLGRIAWQGCFLEAEFRRLS